MSCELGKQTKGLHHKHIVKSSIKACSLKFFFGSFFISIQDGDEMGYLRDSDGVHGIGKFGGSCN